MRLTDTPRVFRCELIVGIVFSFLFVIGGWLWKDKPFAMDVAISSGISVALFFAYVLWIGRLIGRAKPQLDSDETGDTATRVATQIQVASVVKLFLYAGILILLILVFRFQPLAVIFGVSSMYLANIVVPLFSNPRHHHENGGQEAGITEVKDK